MITGKIRQTLTNVGNFRPLLRFRLWFIPVVVVLLLAMGWWMRTSLEKSVKERTKDGLAAILNSGVTSLELWLKDQRAYATVLSGSDHVRRPVIELERFWRRDPAERDGLVTSPAMGELRDYLLPLFAQHDFDGFAVVAPDGTLIGGDRDEWVGFRISPERVAILAKVLAGQTLVSHPFFVEASTSAEPGDPQTRIPIMIVAAPVRDDDDRVIAMLALLVDPDEDFTRILQSARLEDSGETYAFNSKGLLISHSRFDDQLREIGLIGEGPGTDPILTLEIRDPGGDLGKGYSPTLDRGALPLTRMAASAVTGQSGVDVDGYRDYRGVMVVGAWTWLEEYDFGVAAEIDLDEALAMPGQLRRIFWIVIGLFVVGSSLAVGGTLFISHMGRQMSDAMLKAQKLGQYTLEDKLGEGGMGQVFRARHAMLRRPTAIKLLHPDRTGKQDLVRFEREVQITSNLTHPNTIAIFDYGRTPEGVFYYAMEYLPGIDLGKLVEIDGPQPPGRVIHILRQACGSIAEAHQHGLIHRDIKPENIILCERGGRHDVAKVLDFGIVKDISGGTEAQLTSEGTFTGTPLYVPPEAWSTPEKIDTRADIYALGAVAYLLLAGRPIFEGGSVVEIYNHHLKTRPEPPSSGVGGGAPSDLDRVVLRCLEKDRDERPRNAEELERMLAACEAATDWTEEQARDWWAAHGQDVKTRGEADTTRIPTEQTATVVIDLEANSRKTRVD
jgi:serine/threonine protein kinase